MKLLSVKNTPRTVICSLCKGVFGTALNLYVASFWMRKLPFGYNLSSSWRFEGQS